MNGKKVQIKRNIKKTSAVKRDVSIKPRKHKSNGFGKYQYPICGVVPAGYYVTRIMHAEDVVNNQGKDASVIYYKLEPFQQCYQRIFELLPNGYQEKYYYIKQQYVFGSKFYNEFVESMTDALYAEDGFDIEDTIGVEEYVELSYKDYSDIGGFDSRYPVCYDDLLEHHEKMTESTVWED